MRPATASFPARRTRKPATKHARAPSRAVPAANVVRMAPLKSKGDLAELMVAADILRRGHKVAFPFGEDWDYDLIAYAYDQLPGFTDFDLYGSAWDIRSNPAGWNPGGYANAEADAAIEEFLSAVSISRQATAIRRLQHAVNDDLFGLWLGFPDDLVLVAPDIRGFTPDMAWQTARTWNLWRSP